ncbi:MAG TPA: glycosyltransferase family 4 protein, partial [Bacteroidales bacterium]|nr:glycosyltransferase family 4 protein [Bacteroidales bacterium]
MKIISIGPAYPLRGGIARFNESLSLSLQDEGHQVDIISYRFQYPSALFPGKSQFATEGSPPAGLAIESLIHSLSPLSWKQVALELIKRKPDLVIIHYWMPFFAPAMGFICRRLKKFSDIPVILLAHNLIPHETQPGTV